ncbi:LuxR C-terminal-related transcriptional regulator [Lentzea sp. NPDC058436]|uniref:LuxR C-terminal-related transcriptional regulator n=1 Tax=Lentzea sp. NPDC058436 TaxID=3346499 RepID=UPI00365968CA
MASTRAGNVFQRPRAAAAQTAVSTSVGATSRGLTAGGVGLASEMAAQVVSQLTTPEPTMSGRGVEVIRFVAQGLSNRAIASSLFLAETTVETHLVRLHRKLGADNRAGAVVEAERRAVVDP